MIDTLLMHHLLKAIPLTATFILVGDINQLPSVGAGNVLRDIIDSGVAPVVELNEIFRQAQESSIIVNAHKINQDLFPNLKANPDKHEDF
jgi:exodeoxyribonuclease V alpha subunit